MSKQIIITGATGLIGTGIANALISRGDEVYVFTRSPEKARKELPDAKDYVRWFPEDYDSWKKSVNAKDGVIHLAGAPVMAKRWTGSYKAEILSSRQIGTRAIVKAIKESSEKPKVLVCASAIGYYGTDKSGSFTESSPAGSDFLATVCKLWEKEASQAEQYGVRRVSVRTGIVLDAEKGALEKMLIPYRFFMGGPLGKGTQGFPWIHINDLINIFLHALDDESFQGAINAVAPEIISMNEFSEILGRVIRRPSWFRVPEFLLRLVVGEGAETIIKTPRIIPLFLKEHNFEFGYDKPETALSEVLKT